MNFETLPTLTVRQMVARLHDKERADILSAQSEDRIEYLRQTMFTVDGGPPTVEMMQELVSKVHDKFTAYFATA